jgi:hypothetical protein
MSPTGVPEHISIDFREALDPGRGWIVGVADKPARVELLAFEHPLTEGSLTISSIDSALADRGLDGLPPRPRPMMVAPESRAVTATAAESTCTCPEYCDRDHDTD